MLKSFESSYQQDTQKLQKNNIMNEETKPTLKGKITKSAINLLIAACKKTKCIENIGSSCSIVTDACLQGIKTLKLIDNAVYGFEKRDITKAAKNLEVIFGDDLKYIILFMFNHLVSKGVIKAGVMKYTDPNCECSWLPIDEKRVEQNGVTFDYPINSKGIKPFVAMSLCVGIPTDVDGDIYQN